MIASHYAEPAPRLVKTAGPLLRGPAADSDVVGAVAKDDSFDLLDDSLGWAWGYAGADRTVGYLPSEAVG
ncbi:MAG: hypothetical protein M3438_08480 [Pseudomonadota bacterium]|nr:hypothetical protein [Sphingomonas sp.]MDQ3479177.1 hypothetical protein [Pseudomonadota bacterium]